jgi:uroporphyrinogen-III synthase
MDASFTTFSTHNTDHSTYVALRSAFAENERDGHKWIVVTSGDSSHTFFASKETLELDAALKNEVAA